MKRLLSLFLAMLLLFSVMPPTALAVTDLPAEDTSADLQVEDEIFDLPVEDEISDLSAENESTELRGTPASAAPEESEAAVLLDSDTVTLNGKVSLPDGTTAEEGLGFRVQCHSGTSG